MDENLRQCAEITNRTVIIPKENEQALFNLADNVQFSNEQILEAQEALENRSPEENANSLNSGLLNFIDSNGNFMQNMDHLFVNPNSAKSKDEAFSLFALMLLLNQLSSSQRAEFFKGMQAEQANIQILFVQKKEIIETKASAQMWLTVASLGASAISVAGGIVGVYKGESLAENAWSSLLSTSGKFASEAVSGFGNPAVTMKYDVQEAERGGKEQTTQYNKGLQEDSMRQLRELASAINDARKQIGTSDSSVISSVARGMA